MLDELGDTPDAVADTLRALGIRGARNTARDLNPVVRYALARTPGAYAIDLILGTRLRTVFADGRVTEAAVPGPVLRFLEAFHRGGYPDLELPAPDDHTEPTRDRGTDPTLPPA